MTRRVGLVWAERQQFLSGKSGGQGRGRTVDLPSFSRTLVPTELPGLVQRTGRAVRCKGPERTPGPATPTGLEPATFAVTGRRANQLRYGANI